MIIHHADRQIIKWAIDHGFSYEYVREYGLPDPTLRIPLGVSTAFFKAGELVHWRANADARHLDQLMFELTSLFGLCAEVGAYPRQAVYLSPGELASLRPPRADTA